MRARKIIGILSFGIAGISFFSCNPEEIILHGEISGTVTYASTNHSLKDVKVKLNPLNDSTYTGSEGKYLFKNLPPDDYEVQVSEYGYFTSKKNVTVTPAETKIVDFQMDEIPIPRISNNSLDFGFESTRLTFTISNTSKQKITYILTPSQDWIEVTPSVGQITNNTVTITVDLNRTVLSNATYKEKINITSIYNQSNLEFSVGIYLNGLSDRDGNYYKIVNIGTQTWMAENLNTGITISNLKDQTDNDTIEKYCSTIDCSVYGGYYQWSEAMQFYNPVDTGEIGSRQGICPVGWHIPTYKEWRSLDRYLGINSGGKLKETGYSLWKSPNSGATNETGFTGLPGGYFTVHGYQFEDIGGQGRWWSSKIMRWWLTNNKKEFDTFSTMLSFEVDLTFTEASMYYRNAIPVRCIKDP